MRQFWIKVKTNKRVASVSRIQNNNSDISYEVCLTQKPIKGAANTQLIEVIADHFEISKNQVMILSGETSSRKLIAIN